MDRSLQLEVVLPCERHVFGWIEGLMVSGDCDQLV